MFKRFEFVHADKHKSLRMTEVSGYSYAATEALIPLVLHELAEAAREYPIIFPNNGQDLPCALVALEPGRNAYVGEDGRWSGSYIPIHLRRYPFRFGSVPGKSELLLALDPDAPHFKGAGGQPLFDEPGRLSPAVERRVELLKRVQTEVGSTRKLVQQLRDLGVLAERTIAIRRPGEPERRISGLRGVDEKKLGELSDEDFASLRRGALPLAYAQLLSWPNLWRGPLARMYPDLGKDTPRSKAIEFSESTIDFSFLT